MGLRAGSSGSAGYISRESFAIIEAPRAVGGGQLEGNVAPGWSGVGFVEARGLYAQRELCQDHFSPGPPRGPERGESLRRDSTGVYDGGGG